MPKAVLLIGEDPDEIDFDAVDLPPEVTVESIREGLEGARDRLAADGHDTDILWTTNADTVVAQATEALAARRYDVIVIGAGLRTLPPMADQFERLMNAVHTQAPHAALAFNTSPDDSDTAARRWL